MPHSRVAQRTFVQHGGDEHFKEFDENAMADTTFASQILAFEASIFSSSAHQRICRSYSTAVFPVYYPLQMDTKIYPSAIHTTLHKGAFLSVSVAGVLLFFSSGKASATALSQTPQTPKTREIQSAHDTFFVSHTQYTDTHNSASYTAYIFLFQPPYSLNFAFVQVRSHNSIYIHIYYRISRLRPPSSLPLT